MHLLRTHTVIIDSKPYLQDYLKIGFSDLFPTSNSVKKSIKKNLVLVNNEAGRTGTRLLKGDVISFLEGEDTPPKPFDLAFDIVFEDEYLAVINKPAGISVSGNKYRTIQNAIIGKLSASNQIDKLNWPKPVHRLDEPTSGLLLIAKTKTAQLNLSEQFASRTISKTYSAIVVGKPLESGRITLEIDNKDASSEFEVVQHFETQKYGLISLLKLSPLTGRKHQLRIHLASIDCPIMGDKIHGLEKENYFGKGLFLCASEIMFTHPVTKESLLFKLSLPRKFEKYLDRLSF